MTEGFVHSVCSDSSMQHKSNLLQYNYTPCFSLFLSLRPDLHVSPSSGREEEEDGSASDSSD